MWWVTDRNLFSLAVLCYGASALYSIFLWRQGFRRDNRINYCLLLAGCLLHTGSMLQRGLSLARCPTSNLYEATLFIAWTMVAAYLVLGVWRRLRFLGAFASPVLLAIGVFALMPALDTPNPPSPHLTHGIRSLHAALILLACGGFGLAAVAAVMFLTQEHDLKYNKRRAVTSLMPPIQRLETVMSRLILVSLGLMTGGLIAGGFWLRQLHGVYFRNDPIILWSMCVWLFYLGLLGMRWHLTLRSRPFAWGASGGFLFIMLTFWGFYLLSPVHQP